MKNVKNKIVLLIFIFTYMAIFSAKAWNSDGKIDFDLYFYNQTDNSVQLIDIRDRYPNQSWYLKCTNKEDILNKDIKSGGKLKLEFNITRKRESVDSSTTKYCLAGGLLIFTFAKIDPTTLLPVKEYKMIIRIISGEFSYTICQNTSDGWVDVIRAVTKFYDPNSSELAYSSDNTIGLLVIYPQGSEGKKSYITDEIGYSGCNPLVKARKIKFDLNPSGRSDINDAVDFANERFCTAIGYKGGLSPGHDIAITDDEIDIN